MNNTLDTERITVLPARKIKRTPRLLMSDAYTIGGDKYQSDKARTKSTYYMTFRKRLHTINDVLYRKGDDRIIFAGLQRLLEKVLYDPITHSEIDEAVAFVRTAKVTTNGLAPYDLPEQMWRDVVNNYGGYPPIHIKAVPEGSVVYPNEPVVIVTNVVGDEFERFGELAAWFESTILKAWAASEYVTQDQHFLQRTIDMVLSVDPHMSYEAARGIAEYQLVDFGDRSGVTPEESEELGMLHFYTWTQSDTFAGGYQAWKNSGELDGVCQTINALAHRNPQAYPTEQECYNAMYEAAQPGELLSMVADVYDFKHAVKNYLLPLAKRSRDEGTGIVIVARPDSGIAVEEVLYVCRLAEENGLVEYREIDGKVWKFGTFLRFIEANEMNMRGSIEELWDALKAEGFAPYAWGVYGMGGGKRNNIKRDNLSAKYALCAIGNDNEGVVKFSETIGKTTLPGAFKLLRDEESLRNRVTIVGIDEPGEDTMVTYFNGANTHQPFGVGQLDDFNDIKARIQDQFPRMPHSMETPENHGYPASQKILDNRATLLQRHAPGKVLFK
jgi:nicotinamide phosphoribosyltransferase